MLFSGGKTFSSLVTILIAYFCLEIIESTEIIESQEADSMEQLRNKLQEDYKTGAIKMVEFFNSLEDSMLKINERLNQSEENVKNISVSLKLSLEKMNERIDDLETAGERRYQKIMEKLQDKNKTSAVTANVNAGSIKTKNFNCYLTVRDSTLRCSSTVDGNWLMEAVDGGFYTLNHLCSGKALGMIPSDTQTYYHYQKLHVTPRDGAESDPRYHWNIQNIIQGSQTYFKFINRATSLTLDSDGRIIYHHSVNDGEYQLWKFQKAVTSGSCLAIQG